MLLALFMMRAMFAARYAYAGDIFSPYYLIRRPDAMPLRYTRPFAAAKMSHCYTTDITLPMMRYELMRDIAGEMPQQLLCQRAMLISVDADTMTLIIRARVDV